MLHKSFDPVLLEDIDNWLSHVKVDIINQLEIDRSPLLINLKLVKGLIYDVTKVTQARIVNELQQPMLVLMASSISLVEFKDVRCIFLDLIKSESLDIFKHISGGSGPLSLISRESLIHELGDPNCILHVKLFDMIHEAAHDVAIVGEDISNLIGRVSPISPVELRIVSPFVTPNLNSKEAVARDRFLASSLPVP
jgi:hypothetical protein